MICSRKLRCCDAAQLVEPLLGSVLLLVFDKIFSRMMARLVKSVKQISHDGIQAPTDVDSFVLPACSAARVHWRRMRRVTRKRAMMVTRRDLSTCRILATPNAVAQTDTTSYNSRPVQAR